MTVRAYSLPDSWGSQPPEFTPVSQSSYIETPVWEREIWRQHLARLTEAHARLLDTPVERIVASIDRVAQRFLTAGDPLRDRAIDGIVNHASHSVPMAETILDGMAADWTAEPIHTALAAEFADPAVLDRWIDDSEQGRRVRASGPPLSLHIGAGNTPGVLVGSMIQSLVVKSAVLAKPGLGDLSLPLLFREALSEVDSELGEAVAVVYWTGGASPLESTALEAADQVIVFGSDRTVGSIRGSLRADARLISHPHRTGVVLIGRAALTSDRSDETADALALATALFDQRGCVSPHLVFVEKGGEVSAGEFGSHVLAALERLATTVPPGPVSPEMAATVHQWRGEAEMRAASGSDVHLFPSSESLATIVVDPSPTLEPGPGGRCLRMIPVDDASRAIERIRVPSARRFLQSFAVEGVGAVETVAESARRAGVTRVVELAEMGWPKPWTHHDGGSPLAGRVTWCDLEV